MALRDVWVITCFMAWGHCPSRRTLGRSPKCGQKDTLSWEWLMGTWFAI